MEKNICKEIYLKELHPLSKFKEDCVKLRNLKTKKIQKFSLINPLEREYINNLKLGIKLNFKTISMFIILFALPNFLGMINIPTYPGFKIHFFQIAIFLSAIIYGPIGGALSGGFGSIYSGIIMSNPYLVIGNIILGLFTGLFIRHNFNIIVSVIFAFFIQIPWLFLTDFYLIHLTLNSIYLLLISLFISNIIWASVSSYLFKYLKNYHVTKSQL